MKKKNVQRFLSLLLAAVFCFGALSWTAVPAKGASANVVPALSGIPYHGDRSACRMTAEQAEAYAKVIEMGLRGDLPSSTWNSKFKCGQVDENFELNRWNETADYYDNPSFNYTALCDLEGNGIPYLLILMKPGTGFLLFGWQNGAVTYLSGGTNSAGSEYWITQVNNGTAWLRYGAMGHIDGYYKLSNGAIIESYMINSIGAPESGGEWLFDSEHPNLTSDDLDWFMKDLKRNETLLNIDTMDTTALQSMASLLNSYAQSVKLQNGTPQEILEGMSYYCGDASACRMTAAQALAFADVIEQRKQAVDAATPGGPTVRYRYFYASLFDAGDGIPALWICGGYDPTAAFYMDVVNEIWAWDGSRAVLDFEGHGGSRLTDRGIVYDSMGWFGDMASPYMGIGIDSDDSNKALFPLSHGRVSQVPAQVSATVCLWVEPASTEQIRSRVQNNDRTPFDERRHWFPGLAYDYSTVTSETYEEFGTSYYRYHFNGGTGTDGLNWNNTLLRCERENPSSQWASGSVVAAALRDYAEMTNIPSYGFTQAVERDANYREVAQAVSGRGTVQSIYRLLEDLYYVLLENQGDYSGAVVRGVTRNGQPSWEVSQVDEEPAEESALEAMISRLLSSPNLTLDYSQLRGTPAVKDLTAYLQELLSNYDGLSPNDAAKTELASFLDSAVSAAASLSVSGKDNRLTLDSKLVSGLADTAKDVWADLQSVLRSEDVRLNKTITPRARLLWQNLDPAQACQITVDESLVSGLSGADLQLLLGSGDRYVQFSYDNLSRLVDKLGAFSIQFSKTGSNTYSINFLDEDEQVLDSLPSPITLGLPASSMTSTVMVSYAGGSDNWGGQYDEASGVLSFETRYSGQYEVLENNIQIDDITDLSEESQAAIRFLVSKGYLSLDENDLFNPEQPLTRYDFTRTLVSMFFALDRSLSVSFTDVPEDSEYYAYVASAKANQLVMGVTDDVFGGEENLTVAQMLTVTGRTLAEQKGYTLPEDAEQYLSAFDDGGSVEDWARLHVALSVREGLQDRGGMLHPQSEITREQAAVALYRLFLRLYEVPPVALDLPPESAAEKSGSALAIIAAVAAAAAVGAGAAVVIVKKRKTTAKKS